jgi:hypothetical protein
LGDSSGDGITIQGDDSNCSIYSIIHFFRRFVKLLGLFYHSMWLPAYIARAKNDFILDKYVLEYPRTEQPRTEIPSDLQGKPSDSKKCLGLTRNFTFFISRVITVVSNSNTIPEPALCLNASALMRRLSISKSTLYKLVKLGKISPVSSINAKRNRLFRVQDVLDLLTKK